MLSAAELTNELLKLRKLWPDVCISVQWEDARYYPGYMVIVRVPARSARLQPLHHLQWRLSYKEFPEQRAMELEYGQTKITGFNQSYSDHWPANEVVHDIARLLTSYMLEA